MTRHWPLRTVPAALTEQYRAAGWWTDDTLGKGQKFVLHRRFSNPLTRTERTPTE